MAFSVSFDIAVIRMRMSFSALQSLLSVFFVCSQIATTSAQKSAAAKLPRVGAARDYSKAVGQIPDGCGNHFLNFPARRYNRIVYISRADGSGAVMNLDGRDTPLILEKTTLKFKDGSPFATHEYRAGRIKIRVSFWELTDYISEYPATIVLSRGTLVKKLRANGLAQCD